MCQNLFVNYCEDKPLYFDRPGAFRRKIFQKPNNYDTEHDFFWYLQQDGSKKLPGIGGVFNAVNLDVYHYAGQNPVKLVDPDGEA